MGNTVQVGKITWHWASNLVCAGPEERLVVIRSEDGPPKDARGALSGADRMEWRDAAFRKWRIHRRPDGITFSSHYERVGPAPIRPKESLAGMANERLEELLAAARARADGT